MEINNLCKTSYPVYYAKAQKQTCAGSVCQPQNIDVSLYNSKGVRIPFCGLVKGADFIEENCINFLRKIRENRCRKFDEYDIKEMLETLRKEKNSSDRESVLKEVFCIESEDFGKTPPKDFLKRALRLTAGRPEDERFAILEFAQHELNSFCGSSR